MTSTRKLSLLMDVLQVGIPKSSGTNVINKGQFNAIPLTRFNLPRLTISHRQVHSSVIHRQGSLKIGSSKGFLIREKSKHVGHQAWSQKMGRSYLSSSAVLPSPDATKPTYEKARNAAGEEGASTKTSIRLPNPEFDWGYILKEENVKNIQENIENRKGVGDIEKVRALWSKLNFPEEVEVDFEGDLTKIKRQLLSEAINLPNDTHPDVPVGDESQNITVDTIGIKREFNFRPKTLKEIGEDLGMLRTENLGYTTGQKTYYLIDGFAQLEQALVRYTIDHLEKAGFSLVSVPDLIHPEVVERCGFKTTGDRTQVYKLDPHKHGDIALAGTGEMPIAGMLMGRMFEYEELPKKLMTVSRCFRAETSDADEEKGIYRVHQFTKVEMFGVTGQVTGSESGDLLEAFTNLQTTLFSNLGLHFRILDMASQELGAPAYRKYDMEAWMPAKQFWGEISSASNCTDYQSRRLVMKYKKDNQIQHVHTINGTACAVPRMIMAIVENNQNKDGSVAIPEALQPYMDGSTVLQKTPNPIQMKPIKLTKLYKSKTKSQ